MSPVWRQYPAMAWISSPWLSFSGTGSLPRASTQHGTMPLSNWYGAYHSRYCRTASSRPSRSSPSEIIAPSRIQLRAYERVPGCRLGPTREISMCASAVRRVSASGWPASGNCSRTWSSVCRHIAATCCCALSASKRPGIDQAPVCGSTSATSRLCPGSSFQV